MFVPVGRGAGWDWASVLAVGEFQKGGRGRVEQRITCLGRRQCPEPVDRLEYPS